MQSHRLQTCDQLKNVSNNMTIASPTKKVRPIPHSITPRTPTHSITPRTPTKPTEGFITSSPHSGKKSVSKLEIKKKQHSVKLRPPRTPSGTLFSPTYPPAVGANEFHQLEPSTPTTADVTLSPVQKSLQENVAKYSHLPQEFDEYDCDDFNPYGFIASLPPLTPASASPPCLPPKHPNAPPTTLVLDLDETLVHCSTDPSEVRNPDFVFHVEFHGTVYTVNALKRPGLHEFLEYIKDKFEVIIFTGISYAPCLALPFSTSVVKVVSNSRSFFQPRRGFTQTSFLTSLTPCMKQSTTVSSEMIAQTSKATI